MAEKYECIESKINQILALENDSNSLDNNGEDLVPRVKHQLVLLLQEIIQLSTDELTTVTAVCDAMKKTAHNEEVARSINAYFSCVRYHHEIFNSVSLFQQTEANNIVFELPNPYDDVDNHLDLWATVTKNRQQVKYGLQLKSTGFTKIYVSTGKLKKFRPKVLQQLKRLKQYKQEGEEYLELMYQKIHLLHNRCHCESQKLGMPVRPVYLFIKYDATRIDLYHHLNRLWSSKNIQFD